MGKTIKMLKEIIDKFYTDKQKDKGQSHFYITDAGKCGRAIFFKFKNAPREAMEPRMLRLFEHGDHIHQLIMKPLLSTRDIHVVASEVDIPPQEIISGRADAIVSDGKDLYVLDIKSINSFGFKSLAAPKEENVDQVQLYMHYFRIPKGILLYVNKDTQDLKEFISPYDERRVKALLGTLETLKTQIDGDIIPDRLPEYPKGWQCEYCSFRGVCDLAGPGEVNWNEFKNKTELELN